jgi:hypothetical protein
MASRHRCRVEKYSRRTFAEKFSAAGSGGDGISEKRLERPAENSLRQN